MLSWAPNESIYQSNISYNIEYVISEEPKFSENSDEMDLRSGIRGPSIGIEPENSENQSIKLGIIFIISE